MWSDAEERSKRGEALTDARLGGQTELYGGAVVLTTHERSGYFTSVLGEDIDLRLDPKQDGSLQDDLHNVMVAGGRLVVIDEAHFIDVDDMAYGLEEFVQSEKDADRIRIVVVCTQRKEGDALLAFLVAYCGIFDIIYDLAGVDVSLQLIKLLESKSRRSDVLHLLETQCWHALRMSEDAPSSSCRMRDHCTSHNKMPILFTPVSLDQHVEVDGAHGVHVHIELSPEIK